MQSVTLTIVVPLYLVEAEDALSLSSPGHHKSVIPQLSKDRQVSESPNPLLYFHLCIH
jgi:hypothetical protein